MPIALRKWSFRLLILPVLRPGPRRLLEQPVARRPRRRRPPPRRPRRRREPVAGTTSSTSQTSGTLVPQTSTGTEFFSPSKNISCEIDSNFGPSAITSTLCLTISPPKSVTLGADGTLTECTGVTCLSNAGENTPTLAYGSRSPSEPFTCSSSTAGIKCTLANGDGFLISSSAITALGNATVAAGSG